MVLVARRKITIPSLPPEFVSRPELRADLDAGVVAADVALICAPAGYGKTTLLADWAEASRTHDTAWVSVDRDDNDPRRLWAAVVAAIVACPTVPRPSRLHAPWVWRPDAQPEFLAELAEALQMLPRPICLVLDDVHELVDAEVLHGLQIFARIKPATVQLVLSSRLDPPLSLPRLRVEGRLWELRAAQMSFSPDQAAVLLEKSGLHLSPPQVDTLCRRTGGWVAGLRLASLGVAEAPDPEAFLTHFSGDDRSVADYLVGEILSGLPEDVQEFLRLISISDPVPTALAAALSGRADAANVLDRLEHETSLVAATGPERDTYRVQELLRTYLLADVRRRGASRVSEQYAVAARWWADQDQPVWALDHATTSHDVTLLIDLLHRFALRLLLVGQHEPLRRALTAAGPRATVDDPWLNLVSALAHAETGDLPAAQGDLRHARRAWPAEGPADFAMLRAVVEQRCGDGPESGFAPPAPGDAAEVPAEPGLAALIHLSRGRHRQGRGDRVGARAEFDAALQLSREHGFGYLALQCLTLLGVTAAESGDVARMRTLSSAAVDAATDHGGENTVWWGTAEAMLAYTDLQQAEAAEAARRAAAALGPRTAAPSPPLRFALRSIHGAAVFDLGHQPDGLTELRQARAELGGHQVSAQQCTAMAMLELRAALLLGHSAAAHDVLEWLIDRTGDSGDLQVMRAWMETAGSRNRHHARTLIHTVLEGSAETLLPHTLVEAWLLETSIAVLAEERPAARHALKTALTLAEPLQAIRPFAQAGPEVLDLLGHEHRSLGASDEFADRALAAGSGRVGQRAVLSERELYVLALLPSMLSLDDIATDLTVSVNTVKSHVRAIYAKLGVSSRRLAVLTAQERGLLDNHGPVTRVPITAARSDRRVSPR